MATWRDKLRKGSFRGAAFLWERSDTEVGRKTARHDYPLRDEAWVEDLGKAPREFTLDVFVLGPDYMAARDKLVTAIEEPGPGTLVHPTWGTLRVAVYGKVRISETTSEGGMARLTITFVRAGDNKYPSAGLDTRATVATHSNTVLSASASDFAKVLTVEQKPKWIDDHAQALAKAALSRIDAVRGLIKPPVIPAAITSLVATGRQLQGAVSSLVRSPFELAAQLQGYLGGLATISENPFAVYGAYRGLFEFGQDLKPVPGQTSNRLVQAANQKALVKLVQSSAVALAATTISSADFSGSTDATGSYTAAAVPSYQEAVAIRDGLSDRLDILMLDADDDSVYQALAALRADVVKDITTRGADLARVVGYAPAVTLPALVVAHTLYGDAGRADEIISRNRVSHPGFVPGGRPLEVLIDA